MASVVVDRGVDSISLHQLSCIVWAVVRGGNVSRLQERFLSAARTRLAADLRADTSTLPCSVDDLSRFLVVCTNDNSLRADIEARLAGHLGSLTADGAPALCDALVATRFANKDLARQLRSRLQQGVARDMDVVDLPSALAFWAHFRQPADASGVLARLLAHSPTHRDGTWWRCGRRRAAAAAATPTHARIYHTTHAPTCLPHARGASIRLTGCFFWSHLVLRACRGAASEPRTVLAVLNTTKLCRGVWALAMLQQYSDGLMDVVLAETRRRLSHISRYFGTRLVTSINILGYYGALGFGKPAAGPHRAAAPPPRRQDPEADVLRVAAADVIDTLARRLQQHVRAATTADLVAMAETFCAPLSDPAGMDELANDPSAGTTHRGAGAGSNAAQEPAAATSAVDDAVDVACAGAGDGAGAAAPLGVGVDSKSCGELVRRIVEEVRRRRRDLDAQTALRVRPHARYDG